MEWLCGGVIVLAVLGAAFASAGIVGIWLGQRRTLRDGDYTTGWLVEADPEGLAEQAAFVSGQCLISPDRPTARDADLMGRLADRVRGLKHGEPALTKAEGAVARLADNDYEHARVDRLPDDFTGGRKVYLAHLFLFRTDFPGKQIGGRKLRVAVRWDKPGSVVCTRRAGKKQRRITGDDE